MFGHLCDVQVVPRLLLLYVWADRIKHHLCIHTHTHTHSFIPSLTLHTTCTHTPCLSFFISHLTHTHTLFHTLSLYLPHTNIHSLCLHTHTHTNIHSLSLHTHIHTHTHTHTQTLAVFHSLSISFLHKYTHRYTLP